MSYNNQQKLAKEDRTKLKNTKKALISYSSNVIRKLNCGKIISIKDLQKSVHYGLGKTSNRESRETIIDCCLGNFTNSFQPTICVTYLYLSQSLLVQKRTYKLGYPNIMCAFGFSHKHTVHNSFWQLYYCTSSNLVKIKLIQYQNRSRPYN